MNRAYSLLRIKEANEESREITGIATTPQTDRMGDIVEPKGAEFTLPIPLLWQHDHRQPIGEIYAASIGEEGIEIKARLISVSEPASLKERLDTAWASIKSGLVKGLSIGFSAIEYSILDSGGLRFSKWGWHELSAVTIPANSEATITNIKKFDAARTVATDKSCAPVFLNAGVSAIQKSAKVENMNVLQQIKEFEASRAAKAAAMQTIMEKSANEGRTLDDKESEEYDGLSDEIKTIDQHLKRLNELVQSQRSNAIEVDGVKNQQSANDARGGVSVPAVARNTQKLKPGIEFARYTMCLGAAKGDLATASMIAQKRFPDNPRIINTIKAAVEAGTTTDAEWAAPLVEYNQFAGDFVEFLRPQTIIGQFGTNSIPALRSIPFNVHIRGQTSGGAGYWVGEGQPKPLTKFGFNDAYHGYTKVANIAVLTQELMRFSNPSAEMLVRDALAEALIERMDTDFIDPAKAAVANESPASITNGLTPIVSSGNDAAAIRDDLAQAMAPFIAARIPLRNIVIIMSGTTALNLTLMRNTLGQREFPEMTVNGGFLEGIPVIVSDYAEGDSSGDYVTLVVASEIYLSDDGMATIDASREASLQMADDPTNDSTTPTATSLVSMFQTNSVALRAERFVNWSKRRAAAVSLISAVNWGQPTS